MKSLLSTSAAALLTCISAVLNFLSKLLNFLSLRKKKNCTTKKIRVILEVPEKQEPPKEVTNGTEEQTETE